MRLMGIKDVMQMTGVGRPMATRLLREPTCPTLSRHKNQRYLVEEGAFIKWFQEYQKPKKGNR